MNRMISISSLVLGLAAGLSASADWSSSAADLRPSSAAPAWFDEAPEGGSSPIDDPGPITAKGLRSFNEERALADARSQLDLLVADWLAEDLPEGWAPPADLVESLILDRHVEPVPIDPERLGLADDPDLALPRTLYVAALRADLSPDRLGPFLDAHRRQVGRDRLALLGGLGGFVLSCLAILSLYIRADEATRGYYTNRLRLVALASVAGAGAVIARLVT